MKFCRRCKGEFSLSAFGINRATKDGLHKMCKACRNADEKRLRKLNPHITRRANVRWRKKNPERAKFHRDKYFREHRELYAARATAWLKAHPEAKLAYTAAYRSRLAGAKGKHTPAQLRELLKQQDGKCNACLCDISEKPSPDHIVALSRGGSNYISNIQLLCGLCNSRKHAKPFAEFLQSIRSAS